MYKIKETFEFNEAVYSYDDFNHIKDAQTFCDDVKFPDNTVTAILGGTLNMMIDYHEIDGNTICTNDRFINSVYYVFRKTLAGKYLPLHVSMRPKTVANMERAACKWGDKPYEYEI